MIPCFLLKNCLNLVACYVLHNCESTVKLFGNNLSPHCMVREGQDYRASEKSITSSSNIEYGIITLE